MEYSVIIRTTGKAGAKYQQLLNSIQNLIPQPQEVIVVLPEKYELPKERIGIEHFYFCKKGMVSQRLFGIAQCKTKYALIVDDDIAFDSDFVTKLYHPLKDEKYTISAGPLVEFFPERGKQAIVSALCGSAIPTFFHKNRYNTVLRTTGYSYNRNIDTKVHRLYETQTAAWTCFFIDVAQFREINFEEELWLDMHGYATHDDTCMFYKAWVTGHKAVIVSDANYQHLDAKTSIQGIKLKRAEADSFNTYVFWYRFIYEPDRGFMRLIDVLCFAYLQMMISVLGAIKVLRNKDHINELKVRASAKKEARAFVRSEEYSNLKKISKG